jgi:hypothetical protein
MGNAGWDIDGSEVCYCKIRMENVLVSIPKNLIEGEDEPSILGEWGIGLVFRFSHGLWYGL